jgi:hypothetical protein
MCLLSELASWRRSTTAAQTDSAAEINPNSAVSKAIIVDPPTIALAGSLREPDHFGIVVL